MCCCYIIATSRTILWTLLSISTMLSMLAAVITPTWLIGLPRQVTLGGTTATVASVTMMAVTKNSPATTTTTASVDPTNQINSNMFVGSFASNSNKTSLISSNVNEYTPSLGIYNRCTKLHHFNQLYIDSCAPFATSFADLSELLPFVWQLSLAFFALGLMILMMTIVMSVLGCCVRSICKKSIFTITGTIQAIAGLFFLLGLLCYPLGWGSKRVALVCGQHADPFWPGDCQLGWALLLAIGSTAVTFLCSILSLQAEHSTSSDKVQEEILDGKRVICLL